MKNNAKAFLISLGIAVSASSSFAKCGNGDSYTAYDYDSNEIIESGVYDPSVMLMKDGTEYTSFTVEREGFCIRMLYDGLLVFVADDDNEEITVETF